MRSFIQDTDEVGSVWGNIGRGGGMASVPHSVTTNNGLYEKEDMRRLQAAANYNRERRKLLDLENESRKGATFDNRSFFRGLYDAATDPNLLTSGQSGMIDAFTTLGVAQELGKGKHTKSGDILLNALVKKNEAQGKYEDENGWMYNGGVITANMAPFIAQIASAGFSDAASKGAGELVQGAATKVAQGVMKKAAGMVGTNVAKGIGKFTGLSTKAFGKTLQYGIIGAAQANTTGLQNVMTSVAQNNTGEAYRDEHGSIKFGTFDSNGNLVHDGGEDFMSALVHGELSQTIEFATELAGGGIDAVGGSIKRYLGEGTKKLIEKYNMKNVSNVIDFLLNNKLSKNIRYIKNGTERTLGKLELNSIVGESMEEELGIVANAILTGDNQLSDLFDEKQQTDIWGGMLLSMGFMHGLSMPFHANKARKYYQYKHKVDKADANCSQLLGSDKWEELRDKIDATTNEEMPNLVKEINRDVALGKNRQAVREYCQNLLKMRGYDLGNMLAAKKAIDNKGKDVSVKSMEMSQAYGQGYDAQDAGTHEIQLDQSDKAKTLAEKLGISEQQLSAMSDEELDSFAGKDDDLDTKIYEYQVSNARYEGVLDNANDRVDLAAQQASQQVDMQTDMSRGTVRNATIKATDGADDYGVYIVSGNIVTNEDGSINVHDSDSMILYYDPTTGAIEHADASRFAELGEEQNAEEVKDNAITEAKEKAIKEISGIIDGVVMEGTTFATTDEEGNETTYEVLADNGDGTFMVTINGNVDTQPHSLEELQQLKDIEDKKRLEEAKAQRAQLEQDRKQRQEEENVSDDIDYSEITNDDGNVVMVDVLDEDGNTRYPNSQLFLVSESGAKAKVMEMDADGKLKPHAVNKGDIQRMGTLTLDEYKETTKDEEQVETSNDNDVEQKPIEGQTLDDVKPIGKGAFGDIYDQFKGKAKEAINFLKRLGAGETTAALHHHSIGDISLVWGNEKTGLAKILRKHPEVIDNLQSIIDSMEVVSESDNRIKLESPTHFAVVSKEFKGEPREKWLLTAYEKKESLANGKSMDTATTSLGGDTALSQTKGSSESKDTNNSPNSNGNNASLTFEDGSAVPLLEDGNPDFSQMSAQQSAELYDNTLGEDASQVIGDNVAAAKKALDKANGMKVKGSSFLEQKASKEAKERAIAEAQGKYDSAKAISEAYEERQLNKSIETHDGRISLLDKAKAKYARLKGKDEWKNKANANELWNETVGKALHRLYDGLSVNVFDTEPQTLEEYVSGSLVPFSLNYEGNEYGKGVKQETGLERKDFAKSRVLAAEGKGKTIDKLVHELWENRPSQFESYTDQDIREAVIGLITSDMNAYDMRHVIESNRIAQAEKEIEDEKVGHEKVQYQEEQQFAERQDEGNSENSNLPFGEQLDESAVPFSVNGERTGKEYDINDADDRKRLIAENSVDDKDILEIDMPKHVHNAIKAIAKKMGLKVQFLYMGSSANGWIENGTIYLCLDAERAMQFVFGHEMTHAIKQASPSAYKELVKVAAAIMPDEEWDKQVTANLAKYRGIAGYNTADDIVEEVVADALGKFMEDFDLAKRFALKLSHPVLASVIQAIRDIKNLLLGAPYRQLEGLEKIVEKAYVDVAKGTFETQTSGNRMSLRDEEVKEANARFNSEIEGFKNKSHKGLMHLGKPSPILKACGVDVDGITLSPKVLNRKLNQHSLSADDVKDLVNAIQKPMMVYQHGKTRPNIVVITDTEIRGNKLSVALELDEGGNVTELNNVSSVHDKNADKEVERWLSWDEGYFENALRWVDKEKVSDWLSSARLISYSQTENNQKLSSLTKVLKDFKNPKISEKNIQKSEEKELAIPETLEEFLESPKLKFSIKTEAERKAAQNAYDYAMSLRPDKWKQYALVNMKKPNQAPAYYEKKEFADQWRVYANRIWKDNTDFKLFDLSKPFEEQVMNVRGKVPAEFEPQKSEEKEGIALRQKLRREMDIVDATIDRLNRKSREDFNDFIEKYAAEHGLADKYAVPDEVWQEAQRNISAKYDAQKDAVLEKLNNLKEEMESVRFSLHSNNNLFGYFDGTIKDLIDSAKTSGSKLIKKIISTADDKLIGDLHDKGVDITSDYKHTIDNNAINHAIKRHGSEKERLQGQLPITEKDLENVGDVIDNYDSIETEKNKRGQDVIIYTKQYADGITYYIEEVRTGRKELAMDSIRKRKTRKLTDANSNATPISDLSSGNSSAKIDNSSETAKEKGGKFSLKDGKTLVGVHNISEDKLKKAIKQGGLANPSVAVIDLSKQAHEGYGEISLIMPSEKIAKRTGRNAGTWQGDAWTPTYPQVERQMGNQGAELASKDIMALPKEMQGRVRMNMDAWLDNGNGTSGMAYMFLYERGDAPEMKTTPSKYSEDTYNELRFITAGDFNLFGIGKADMEKVLDMYVKEKYGGDRTAYEDSLQNWVEKNKMVASEYKKGFRKAIARQNLDMYENYGFNFKSVQNFARDVEYDHRKGGKADIDRTLKSADDYIIEHDLIDEFSNWMNEKEKLYEVKEVIFDGFTPSGKRKYVPNTLENASKIMKRQGRNGSSSIAYSFNNFAAKLMPSYGKLDEIRSKKNLLTSDHEELDKFREKWGKVFIELGEKCQPDADNKFEDYGMERLAEAALQKAPQVYLKKEYNVDFSDTDLKKLNDMIKAIKEEYPAMYFETKFERPVELDEFKAAVIPSTLSNGVKESLQEAGIPLYEYDRKKMGDRKRAFEDAVGANDDVRFSIKTYHGSGADFDYFDHSHMGEGEGRQAYGWGTYVTEVKGIGKNYAQVKDGPTKQSIVERKDFIKRRKKDIRDMGDYEKYAQRIEKIRKDNVREYNAAKKAGDESEMKFYADLIAINDEQLKPESHRKLIESFGADITKSEKEIAELEQSMEGKHHLYTVEIPDDTGENYLDWDKEYTPKETDDLLEKLFDASNGNDEQMEAVQDFSNWLLDDEVRSNDFYQVAGGRAIYNKLAECFGGSDQKASELLAKAGFAGIKYPADYLRGGREDGKKNYVIFNEKDAKIVEHTKFSLKNLDEVNNAFNDALKDFTMENADKVIFHIGMPSEDLLAGGVANKPLKLYGSKLAKKIRKHDFEPSDLKDLPKAMQHPIAVFNNHETEGNRSVLTELKINGDYVLVSVTIGKAQDADINIISSTHGKRKSSVIEWFKKGLATFVNNKKAQKYLNLAAPIAAASNTNELSAAKVGKTSESSKENTEKFSLKDSKELDEEYMKAVENGDMEKAQTMVNEAAKRAGYSATSDYQGASAFNGTAPWGNGYFLTREERKEAWENDEFDGDSSLGDYIEDGIDGGNLEMLTNSASFRSADSMRKKAILNVRNAINSKAKTIKMYRSVPTSVKEGSFRNGDWITPSKDYAKDNAALHGWGDDYRIIEQDVPVDDVWFDGNDIAEWGYGREEDYANDTDFAYKNTENNKKLLEPVTYDDEGKVIPLSKRFDEKKSDVRFSMMDSKEDRIQKLRESKPIEITGKEITPSDDLKQYKKNALEYGKTLRGKYTNEDTGEEIDLTGGNKRGGIREILQHDYKDIEHLQSIAAIPQIIRKAIFIDEMPNEDKQNYPNVKSFRYYICGLKIGNNDYTVKAVVAEQNNGNRYYDHRLTNIEKGKLLSIIPTIQKAGIDGNMPNSWGKDKRLVSILQAKSENSLSKGVKFSLRYEDYEKQLEQWKKDNGLPEDAQRPTLPIRNTGESAMDYMARVQQYRKEMALWKTAPTYETHLLSSDKAQGIYNRELQKGSVLRRIAVQDSMLAIRKAQEAIMKEHGAAINMAEDAYTAENRSHGKGKNELEEYNDEYMKPLRKAYNDMMKALGNSYDNVKVYMMAKHGLERNAHMAFNKALEHDYKEQKDRIDAYNKYKGDLDRVLNDASNKAGSIDFTTWRRKDNAIRMKYAPSYMEYRYDKMGITQDYAGLSALFDGSSFEEDAAALVKEVEDKHSILAMNLWDATNDATKKILKNSYDAGFMSKEVYEYVRNMYGNYIPLRGWSGTQADQVWDYIGGGKGAFNQTLKDAHGRSSIADDPIAYIENMAESGIIINNKNWVKQHLLLLAQNRPTSLLSVSKAWYIKTLDGNGNEVWEPASPGITVDMTSKDVKNALDKFEKRMEQLKQKGDATQKRGHLDIEYPKTNSESREHEVRVMKDGEEYVIYVNGDPQLAQAMNNSRAYRVRERLEDSKFDKGCELLGRKMATLYTSLSPLFIPANYTRDLTMTLASTAVREDARYNYLLRKNMLTSWGTMKYVLEYQNGTLREKVRNKKASKTEEMFYDYMMNGGETGFVTSMDVDDLKKKFKNELNDMNRFAANPKKVGHVIMDSIETLNRAIEDSNRFMIYKTSIEYGRSIEEAVNDAKDVTLNFNRKGTGEGGWQQFRNLYLFVNPAIQSLQTMGALAKKHPMKFTAVTTLWMASGMLVPAVNKMLLNMFGGDDDKNKYWSFSKWDRRNNLIMWIPFTNQFVKIPLAQEFRGFYAVGDIIASMMYDTGKTRETWEEYAEDMVGQVVDMLPLDPTGYDGNLVVSMMPNAIRPMFELAFNVDFTGKPLFRDTDYNKYDPNFTKAYVGTPDWLVRLSKMLNSVGNDYPDVQQNAIDRIGNPRYNLNNPAVVDHILSAYLGGSYTVGSQILGLATKSLNSDSKINWADVPIMSRFVMNPDDRPVGKKQGDEFWNMKDGHDRIGNTLSKLKKKAKEDGDYSELERFYSSNEYAQYKSEIPRIKQYEEDKKKEKAEISGEEYAPHKTNGNDVYNKHATVHDDFEDIKMSQLYTKANSYRLHYNVLNSSASVSVAEDYYKKNKADIDASEQVADIKNEIAKLKKTFIDEGKENYNAEDMNEIRKLRKEALRILESAR